VRAVGAEHLVIETDCPDMTPLCCQNADHTRTRNTPANLAFVLMSLAESLEQSVDTLAPQLWRNSLQALALS